MRNKDDEHAGRERRGVGLSELIQVLAVATEVVDGVHHIQRAAAAPTRVGVGHRTIC